MGSETVFNGGKTAAVKDLPKTAKNVVATVKEIVNCTEQEIYDVLKDCNMDPNLAVEKLLAQDTFHEVRSKREKRKEVKEASDSRTRSNSMGWTRGGKIGIGNNDPGVVQSGFSHVTYKENGKSVDKQDVGSVYVSVTSSTTHYVRKSSKSDSSNTDNGRQSLGTGVSMSDTAQVSSAPQSWSAGVSKGHLSMADIVRMGRTSQDVVSHNHCNSLGVSSSGNSESSLSLPCQNNSEQHDLHNEWPVTEQPFTGNAQALNMPSSNVNGPFEHPNLHVTEVSLHRNNELDAAQVSWEENASDNAISGKIDSASNLENTTTSDFRSSRKHHEGVSSVALDLQRLSMEESHLKAPSSEDTVVLPNHLQALAAECSHLSFGTYKGGNNSSSSGNSAPNNLSRSGFEMKPAAVEDSLVQFPDASSLNHGNDQLGFDTVNHGDEQLGFDVLRGISGDQSYNPSAPREELVKHTVYEKPLGHEYSTAASISDPILQKSHWEAPSLPLKQPGLQSGSHSSFPGELHNNSNLGDQDLLAFLRAQSRARRINAGPPINNFPLSVSEDMEPGTFALHNRPTPTQGLTVQPNKRFQQLPDMTAYHSLSQNQSYMTAIDSQRAFSDNTAYSRYPANMNYNNLPQNRNEFLMSRLPPSTAGDAHGYVNLDSSFYHPGNLMSNTSVGNITPSSNFNEILPSQYIGGHNMSSIQPQDSFSQWQYGTESISPFLPEKTQYNLMEQSSQASLSHYATPLYSDFHPSWSQIPEEHKQSGSVQDMLPRQLHQFWQHNH
ncbi:RNA polymerase II degradation factor protein [Trifolium repens]|nr:RNA polymerase II degradation factor protein [Trifolium repens]